MTKLRDTAKEEQNRSQKLNQQGKRKETVHAGGTPDFNEATGKYLTPAEKLLRKNFKWAK